MSRRAGTARSERPADQVRGIRIGAGAYRSAVARQHSPTRLDAILRTVAAAPKGQRNGTAFWAAHRILEMIAVGEADDAVLAALAAAGQRAGLSAREIQRIIDSAMRNAA